MRLTKLRLQNYRIHRDSVLEIGDAAMVAIFGPNWSGKSTIGQAISMAVTPTTTGLDQQGRDFISKIRRGEAKSVITADLQTKHHLIQRTVTLHATATGRTRRSASLTSPEWNPAPFDRKLEEQRAALTVALNTDAFLRMDVGEQKNLLAGLALPSRYDFDPEIVAGVEQALGAGVVRFDAEPFAVITQAYKKLFDERQIVNRQVREFLIPEPLEGPAASSDPAALVGIDSVALQERLGALRTERGTRQHTRDTAVETASRIEAERERLREKRASLLTDERLEALKQIAAGKAELAKLTKERKQAESEIDGLLRQLGKLDEIPEAGADCPTCQQFIDPEKMAALTASLHQTLRQARDRQFALHQQAKGLGEVEEALKQIAAHQATLRQLQEMENPAQPPLFDFAPYDSSLAEVDQEIETLSAQIRPLIAAEERAKEIAIRQAQLARLKERAGTLDRLVKFFDKDGIKAKLLGEYIGGFEAKLNEVLSAWGYACALQIEPYSFEVTNARGDAIPVRELSGAERVMFSLAFQCAVSRTASVGLVVIDEVAMFLPAVRPLLYTRLQEMLQQGYLEQVILLVAGGAEEASDLPGATVFYVNDGAVRPMPISVRKEAIHERRNEQRVVA